VFEFLGPIRALQRATFLTTGTATEQPRDWLKTPTRTAENLCQLAQGGLLFNLNKQDYTFRARIQGSVRPPKAQSPRLEQVCLLGGKCRGNIAVHRVRSSDTRDDAFVEARPGRKKISRNLLHAISPHSPGFILLACPSSSIDFEP
jgi:hypothetical protein